tara:strand:+ start:154 stop:651 length:498 start_codon:yes stop_codon:yes gene_type:complete
MRRSHLFIAISIFVTIATLLGIFTRTNAIQAAGSLTGSDIAEIQQLYARYNQGLDFRDQDLLLSIFADDAIYTTGSGEAHSGKEAIKKWAEPLLNAGPTVLTHNNTSIVITPTADGAKGRGYWMLFNVEQQPPQPLMTGYYEDTFTKTSQGWRIKTRGSVRGWSQ